MIYFNSVTKKKKISNGRNPNSPDSEKAPERAIKNTILKCQHLHWIMPQNVNVVHQDTNKCDIHDHIKCLDVYIERCQVNK